MLVYGDAQFEADLGALWRSLGALGDAARSRDVGAVRTLLVAAGQVEQAVHDLVDPGGPSSRHPAVARAHALTAWAGRALLAAVRESAGPERHVLEGLLAPLPSTGSVLVKIPEGFAHYGVFPEAFFDSARRWLSQVRPSGSVVVLGIRSIGTALAAAVAALLEAEGRPLVCHTVRPCGHPFERRLDLGGWPLPRRAHVLVVDEGPGLSGSSLAATVRAVHAAGLEPASVALLPSHAGEPGPMAPAWVRGVWAATARFPAVQDWSRLEQRLAEVLPQDEHRRAVATPTLPPPVPCSRFVRPFVLVEHGRTLAACKLAGLAVAPDPATGELRTYADIVAAGLRRRAAAGFGPPVLGARDGFVVLPWAPAGGALAGAGCASGLSAYLAATAGPPLSLGVEAQAAARLAAILDANAADIVPEPELAAAREALSRRLGLAAATDYDLGAHHWLGPWKVGGRGAALPDHTAVGVQSILWSFASAVVELGVDPTLPRAGLGPALRATVTAYAAFRRGQARLCADTCGDPDERSRAAAATARYEGLLSGSAVSLAC